MTSQIPSHPTSAAAPTPAPGITSLPTLLSTLTPTLHPQTFVFLTLPPSTPAPSGLFIQMLFREAEGLTVITTPESAAEHGLEYTFHCRMITLNVHSSLEAVGFIAYVATELGKRGIGGNCVSGFWHDHLFVGEGREGEAIGVLEGVAREARLRLGEEKR